MRKSLCLLAVMLLAVPAAAQERDGAWEGAAFVSLGSIGLNYAGIAPDVREFIGPAYSLGEDTSLMVGFNFDFAGGYESPAKVSMFLGGNFRQWLGVGYAFEILDEAPPPAKLLKGYTVRHALLFGVLGRHPDF